MKLSKRALGLLEDRKRQMSLALALDFSEAWILRLLDANKDNGPLTTIKALQVIMAETKLTQEEILEEVSIEAVK